MRRTVSKLPARSGRLIPALFVAIQAGILPTVVSSADDPPRDQGKITLYADFLPQAEGEPSTRGLYVIDPATGARTEVATFPVRNGLAPMTRIRVSPDGTRVAFNEFEQAEDRSHVYPASTWLRDLRPGAEPRQISTIGGLPIWSPDGKGLLLVESIGEFTDPHSRYATWKIDADGSHPVRLPIPETDMVEDWSPDGRWLVAVSPAPDRADDLDVVVMHPDGTARRRLTKSGRSLWPRFSPDGRRIAYYSESAEGKGIWLVDLDGNGRRKIHGTDRNMFVEDDSFVERVTWSPDGKHLAAVLLTWTRNEDGSRTLGGDTFGSPRLAILNLDGTPPRIVPLPPARVLGNPDWR